MKISLIGIAFIKNEERFVSKPYLDSVGVPTIGYGSTRYENGARVQMTDKAISEARAAELLAFHVDVNFSPAINNALKVAVTQNQFDALTSFTYNIGGPGMAGSTLLKKINAGLTDQATITKWFGVWNKGTIKGQKVELKGLTLRRKREAELFLKR